MLSTGQPPQSSSLLMSHKRSLFTVGTWCAWEKKKLVPLTAGGLIIKAMRGLVGGAAVGSTECRKQWTTALISRSSGHGTHPSGAERAQAARAAWGGGWHKTARGAEREQGRSKTGTASLPHVKLAPMSAPGPTSECQEHLDAAISFAGAGQRR